MENGGRELAEITISTTNNIQTTSLEQRIEETKWLLHPLAGRSTCCIFRVTQCLVEINKNTYHLHIVSIGPYHYGEEHLEMMQQYKWRCLHDLLARTPPTGPRLDDYLPVVGSMEEDIRGCYSETISYCSLELIEMMVLDGLFVIELFCKVGRLSPSDPDDPIFNLAWIFPNLIQDLFRLQNQIPFLVLQTLFDKSKPSRQDSDSSLGRLALEFFNYAVEKPDEVLQQHSGDEGRHLLDFLRLSFIPQSQEKPTNVRPLARLIQSARKPLSRIRSSTGKAVKKFLAGIKFKTRRGSTYSIQFIQSAKKLHLAGIKFKAGEAVSFLDIKFSNGVRNPSYYPR